MSETAKATEESMITYYIETTDGMYRFNIPKTWNVGMDHTRNGVVVAAISDDSGSIRQIYSGVQTIRDSSTQIQTLNLAETQPEDTTQPPVFAWENVSPSDPTSSYTLDNMQIRARRRRRVQVNLEDSIDFIDDPEPY